MTLFHFTCTDHGEPGIRRGRRIVPNTHPLLRLPLAWFTDDPAPDADAVGLTSRIQPCDRMAYRVTVPEHPHIVPWRGSPARAAMPPDALLDLERFGSPDRWFVASTPVPAGDIVRRPKRGWS